MVACFPEISPRELMAAFPLKREEYAEITGMSLDTINTWLSRNRPPNKSVLRLNGAIARQLVADGIAPKNQKILEKL